MDGVLTLTPAQRRALEIVRDHGPIAPREFAAKMWPDSDGWHHHVRCGNGSHQGGGMHLAGGAYLGKLRKAGLVHWYAHGLTGHGYIISQKGSLALER